MEFLAILISIPWTDILWISLGVILTILGLLGCFLPIIPGPPLSFAALLMLQLKEEPPFSVTFLLIMAGVAIFVTVLDYVVPVAGAKKFGASKAGVWGSTIGLILGIFILPPWGIIVMPFIGALIGEFIIGKQSKQAFRAAWGTFLGFLTGVLLKLIASGVMAFYFFSHII
ncbi:MAG: DUF456 domain-containing protein [Bacteroidales bacterium]